MLVTYLLGDMDIEELFGYEAWWGVLFMNSSGFLFEFFPRVVSGTLRGSMQDDTMRLLAAPLLFGGCALMLVFFTI